VISRDDGIALPNSRGKSTPASWTIEKAVGVGIAPEDGIIEIEDQPAHAAPEQSPLPTGQETALENHGVRIAEIGTDTELAVPGRRQRPQLESVPSAGEFVPKSAQAVAAAHVFRRIDESNDVHVWSSMTRTQ
jgi:hypothetical protein